MDHQQAGRLGGLTTWARTVDRTTRTSGSRSKSPSEIEWHMARLGPEFDGATDAQRVAAAESARRAYFLRLAMKSAEARRRGAA